MDNQHGLPDSSGDVVPLVNSQERIAEENIQLPISEVQQEQRPLPGSGWAKFTTGMIVTAALVIGAYSAGQ
ncbi:MAG: hypothetical protein KF820_02405 [Candidatus Paracaedibacteraceae bacterium]|nr:hypothetical protein [Candidatus Paracaedibacteraceae bacterium]